MANTRKVTVDDREITIVEDTNEELHNFLDEAQSIENLSKDEQEEAINAIFGTGNEGTEQEQPDEQQEEPLLPAEFETAKETLDQTLTSRSTNSQRANTDVVLAIMIANQVATETAANPCYVVHGARLICSMGSREARLVVPLDHGTNLKEKPQMVDQDYASLENVKCFGNCLSTKNPNMEQAAIDATNQYNVEKSQTTWGKIKAFFGVKPKKVDSVSEELKAACICECIPEFVNPWIDGTEKNEVDDKKALIQTCTLVCQYGGIIRIIDNGQDS